MYIYIYTEVCICMYVCMYIYICIYIYIHSLTSSSFSTFVPGRRRVYLNLEIVLARSQDFEIYVYSARYKLVPEGEGRELDVPAARCRQVLAYTVSKTNNADREVWDIVLPHEKIEYEQVLCVNMNAVVCVYEMPVCCCA